MSLRHVFASLMVLVAASSSPGAYAHNPNLEPGPAMVEALCKRVEGYQPGSNHYFVCLNTGHQLLAMGATGQELVEGVCESLRDLFYETSSVERCFTDGTSLLGE